MRSSLCHVRTSHSVCMLIHVGVGVSSRRRLTVCSLRCSLEFCRGTCGALARSTTRVRHNMLCNVGWIGASYLMLSSPWGLDISQQDPARPAECDNRSASAAPPRQAGKRGTRCSGTPFPETELIYSVMQVSRRCDAGGSDCASAES